MNNLKNMILEYIGLTGGRGASKAELIAAVIAQKSGFSATNKSEFKDASPKVSFAEYLQTVQRHQAANQNKVLRNGQIYFNVLCDIHPSLAESIRAGDIDPFYRDDLIPAFIEHLSKEWSPEGSF